MAFEYTTTGLVQAELNSSTAFSSSTYPSASTVTTWIQEESAYINSIADTVFSTTAVASEFIDYEGGDTIVLEHAPVTTFTSLQYNVYKLGSSLGPSWVTKTEGTDYTVYSDVGMIRRLDNWTPKPGLKRMAAAYTYGYTTTPEEVQKLATKLVAKRVVEALTFQNLNERNDGGTVSVGSISIVEPADYGIASYRTLTADIENYKKIVIDNFRVTRTAFHTF